MRVRFQALATDYDRTLAEEGQVASGTIEALARLRSSGRRAFLVTGRTASDLQSVFSRLDLLSAVVAENGAVLYFPASGEERLLAPPPVAGLVEWLRAAGVPVHAGRAIVAMRVEHRSALEEALHEQGTSIASRLRVIPNKDSLMVLP